MELINYYSNIIIIINKNYSLIQAAKIYSINIMVNITITITEDEDIGAKDKDIITEGINIIVEGRNIVTEDANIILFLKHEIFFDD